ncbi:MAG: HisA/HisF-related TIM barrel protein, partial [Gillisia sp.]
KVATDKNLFQWAKEAQDRGAGEILFTSMNNDGTKKGFANGALAKLSSILNIPVIASGGAGSIEHFYDAFTTGKADAALAASIFHYKEIEIGKLKQELRKKGISMRL